MKILIIVALSYDFGMWLESTNRVYCQGDPRRRKVYVAPDPLFENLEGTHLQLLLQFCGLSDAGSMG